MPITIYGTRWCDDTRRTRAFLASKGIRPKFVDIEARPDEFAQLSDESQVVSIPVVVLEDGTRLDEPSDVELDAAINKKASSITVRHRTKLNKQQRRFEQYRDDVLVASAGFVERDNVIVIVRLDRHEDAIDDAVERLTSGLVEIATRANRTVDIDLDNSSATPATHEPEPQLAPEPEPVLEPEPMLDSVPDVPVAGPAATCPLSQRFSELWSNGVDHREAAQIYRSEGISRLAIIKGLHTLWEMPLTPEAMALAFGEAGTEDLAAMYHVLGWIIAENPTSTMSEFQAFDDATGVSMKTEALSLAKRPRDTIMLVDRMTTGLHLRAIDEAQARQMAAEAIREADGVLRIQDQSTLRLSFGWMFLYQSTEYLETGDYSTMISGNAPLLVDRFTGALWVTGTEERPDVYAANYAASGDPSRSAPIDSAIAPHRLA